MAECTDKLEFQTVLHHQQQEFVNAKTLDSDLDLAFQLQLQEAVNASLAQQPSDSSSADSKTVVDVVSAHGDQYDSVIDLATTLMLEDMQRCAQEVEDREQCLAEMRKMREDLDRRIFDQKFATDIFNIPEDQWQVYGDNYHKPYEKVGSSAAASSSSSSQNPVTESEFLRLYFKGLVSEERVRDTKVTVASLGIAICDSKDHMIFEVRKPLEAIGPEGVALTAELAELQALIEGMNSAILLGFKKLTLFCDDYMLYQYVTGRLTANNSKLATLVNQVFQLRREFAACDAHLVGRNDIKFAFKSAREAIISQISWSVDSEDKKTLKETCVICFEDVDVDRMFSVDDCLHRFCYSCMKQHVEVKMLNGKLANCPHENCNSEVTLDSCKAFLAPQIVHVMTQRIRESAIPVTEKVYCPYPKCSALMSKQEVLEYTKRKYITAETNGVRRCVNCKLYFCINCMVPWHYEVTCTDYRMSNAYLQAAEAKLKNFASKKCWRQCVKCKHVIELAEGCYHITCRCGYEFCYTCGAHWKNKKATCKCPIWDEANIIRNGRQR